jgi:putative restriction endonuclease
MARSRAGDEEALGAASGASAGCTDPQQNGQPYVNGEAEVPESPSRNRQTGIADQPANSLDDVASFLMEPDDETVLRERIMASLAARVLTNGGSVTRAELEAFPVSSTESRRLIDTSKGIWNPRDLQATLSVLSSRDGPYSDRELEGGLFRYDYRSGSSAGDNSKLRCAADLGLPIILLLKISTGVFVPIFPVYVLSDDGANRQFVLALDESLRLIANPLDPTAAERRYAERVVRQRLHQAEFRGRVIRAYRTTCAVCSLRHGELLDAAHIVPDGEQLGQPVVPNGLSLCKIHHAAYDRNLMGITPDLIVRINDDLLAEIDGPMLEHGLKEMHGRQISVPAMPTQRPDPTRLDLRYQLFLESA